MHNYDELAAADGAPLLIVAVTGRALAASAVRGGHRVAVLDYFADRDTCAAAPGSRSVTVTGALRFDRRKLLEAADSLAPPDTTPQSRLIYGAGFEGRIQLLRRLATGRRLLGNPPAVVAALRRPQSFFSLLTRLEIPYPEVRWTLPPQPEGWLSKHPGGAGGTRVHPAGRRLPAKGSYFQRLASGRTLSVLFLANGREARILGFNEQWSAGVSQDLPYLYAGAVGQAKLDAGVRDDITRAVDRLVDQAGLLGLNGLDFIFNGESWLALEVNPRPTATVELYDPDYPRGLFDWHLRACTGELPTAAAPALAARAHALVHAPAGLALPQDFQFPEWCRDIPHAQTSFQAGEPFCTVHAADHTPDRARALVLRRAAELEQVLAHFQAPVALT